MNSQIAINRRNWMYGRELAAGIAATLLFFLSMLIIPVAGVLPGTLTPLPALLSLYRWGGPCGYGVAAGAGVMGCLLLWQLGMATGIPYLLMLIALGVILGWGVRRDWPIEKSIIAGTVFLFVLGSLAFWIEFRGAEGGLLPALEADLAGTARALLQQYGVNTPEASLLEQTLQSIVPVMVRVFPGLALSSALIVSWLNVVLASRYSRTPGLPIPPWGDLSRWKAPEWLVWGVILSGAALLLPVSVAGTVGLNALTVLGTIYLFQGLSVVSFYVNRYRLPRLLRALLYVFLLLQQFATLGTMLMGLFDVWFDFRRLTPKPADPANPAD